VLSTRGGAPLLTYSSLLFSYPRSDVGRQASELAECRSLLEPNPNLSRTQRFATDCRHDAPAGQKISIKAVVVAWDACLSVVEMYLSVLLMLL
jgi:hypothetical protein